MNKIIHQIWIGPNEMPVREQEFCKLIKSKNPSWEYMFWTNDNLPKLPENIQQTYDLFGQLGQYAFQADVLRLYLIKEYGGIYIDVDFKPLTSFDSLAELDDFFLTWGLSDNRIMNGFLAAKKNHPAIVEACKHINKNTRMYSCDWFAEKILPYKVNTMKYNDFLEKYAFHYHLNSWMP